MSHNKPVKEPIVIIGSGCRFAGGANSPSKLWDLLRNPKDLRSDVTSRFNSQGYYHKDGTHHGHMNVLQSYLIGEDTRLFDAEFFGVNPVEAKAMDPQQRLLLEVVYEAIESAGLSMERMRGSDTAVFAGLMCGDYEAMMLRDLDQAPTHFAIGTSRAILSNRVSYFFDWHGPSITIDTACSSSLVAVHHAVQALRSGDSHAAIACGSNLILGPEMYVIESKLKMLSPDGLSRMWDKDANGYARGEGVTAVVLKTLSQALADNDRIEAVIRETGVNQDGATPGITMPSASAQRALIHSVYRKAGLDPESPNDRPQYIESHGTGTPAGDPIEAEALCSAFFATTAPSDNPIYTGSIKTVLGHTEGSAGIAALLKVTKAIQNATVPPNLWFQQLNHKLEPFYGNIQIPTQPVTWPATEKRRRKRASINNFGFGGTNAHAIVEGYEPKEEIPPPSFHHVDATVSTPFVFSAASKESLRANLAAYALHLDAHPQISTRDLAYTLRERRSVLPFRIAFPESNTKHLKLSIAARLSESDGEGLGVRTWAANNGGSSKLLGIFTGQGAQYARMGTELLAQTNMARKTLEELEGYLAELPEEDRPSWSLQSELLADPSVSRVGEAAISQPLCTAVQIILVKLLCSAKVRFDTVIGHSSGEIAAAYAAGYLSARDALLVAYYRGLHCKLAASPNGNVKGAMLAAGTSLEDATELCEDEEFSGRINVAASNSSSSVTISGDEDAIDELATVFDDEKKFNRRLKVDTAYHSKHMLPCFEPYVASLRRVGITVLPGNDQCTWISSVHEGRAINPATDELADVYWAQNMTKPVLFSQAVQAAVAPVRGGEPFAAALEVGPHAALAGPAKQTIQEVAQKDIPYHGSLVRGENATKAFATCLGFLWERLDAASLDLGSCEAALSSSGGVQQYTVLADLPTYQWKHETVYWAESRRSRRMRLREGPFHQLLGNVSPDSAPHILRWKNVLKPKEMTWLEGHQVQNQVVLPAATYVCTAIEAARSLAQGKNIQLIELSNFCIHNAITFDQNDVGVEVLVELSRINVKENHVNATFTYTAGLGDETNDLALAANGELNILLVDDDPSLALFPERQEPPPHMIPVQPSRLYDFMKGLEYDFSGPFQSLAKLERKLGTATCLAKKARKSVPDADDLLVHPVDLDAAFQSVMLAYSYPGDDQLRLLHLPTSIERLRVNPAALSSQKYVENDTTILDSTCTTADRAEPGNGFSGSVNMYAAGFDHAAIQVEQVKFKPVGSDAKDDRNVFYKMHWVPSKPDGLLAAASVPITERDRKLMFVLSRIAAYYLRKFDEMIAEDDPARLESPLCHYMRYARHMMGLLRAGEHKWAYKEWLQDTEQDVFDDIASKGFQDNSDVRIMLLVGSTMPRVFRRETTMLEHFRTSGLLDEYYSNGFGTKQCTLWVAGVLKQLADCNPHLNMLEIGAGTGSATKTILKSVGHDFASYTFTDISSSFFENAAETFSDYGSRMVFKVCNAENDPVEQGFEAGTYDVVIAFMVVHACAKLDEAVANLRKLLKPGGLLVLGEGASDGAMQAGAGFIFGTLPGWWRGVDEGRTLSPLVSASEWQVILRDAGFSGIDTMSPPELFDAFGITLFVSTAVDERIEFVRNPRAKASRAVYNKVVIVGGITSTIAKLAEEIQTVLTPLAIQVLLYTSLEDLQENVLDDETVIISLVDLEAPVFKDITSERWYKFRLLFETKREILWLTSGRLEDEPYSNMTVGFGRSAMHEEETLRVQYLDVADVSQLNAVMVMQYLLRFTSSELDKSDILYTKEPEVIIDANGRELVPRLFTIQAANNRLNSVTRPIYEDVDTSQSVVELRYAKEEPSFRKLSRYEVSAKLEPSHDTTIKLRVAYSVISALRCPAGYQYLIMGFDESGARRVALVNSLTSVLCVPLESTILCELSDMSEPSYLTLLAAEIIAMTIVDPLFTGQKLAILNASKLIIQAIASYATAKGVETTFIVDAGGEFVPKDVAVQSHLPLYPSRSDMSFILPTNLACFVSFSALNKADSEDAMKSLLPFYCQKMNTSTLFSTHGVDTGALGATAQHVLSRAISSRKGRGTSTDTTKIDLEALASGKHPADPLAVIDWTPPSTSLSVRITRFEMTQLFKADKTYWLVGLSGALGISLCDWMIERGVKYLVLTSRNPKIDERWIENHEKHGVMIKILLCDVTDEAAIKDVHQTIVRTLPPIAGLLNGAMVLRDVSVRNMEYAQVTDVIRPKVLGSIHLDRIFHDIDLDFFVLLSSINCVIGNVGQANYAAANMGMIGVAGHRRKRGLRSSVVNVGAIIGVGYITQSDRQLDVTVAKTAMMHLSEQDFHQIFAECMEAGHLDNDSGPEISTGLLEITPDTIDIPPWYSDPKFKRFQVHQAAAGAGKAEVANSASTQELLLACRSQADITKVVQQAYCAQLRRILQVSTADEDLMMMRGVDLGFDSLLSVDVRSWFLKNFRVSIPVLKIMANDVRMSTLVDLAAESIPAELIPHVQQQQQQAGRQDASSNTSSDDETASTLPTSPESASPGTSTPVPEKDISPVDTFNSVDWYFETTPPSISTFSELTSAPAPRSDPKVVVLTGCSGLLGHHLLSTLIAQPSIRKIICLAVRSLPSRLSSGELPLPGDKIEYHAGDLTAPQLGLSTSTWISIFKQADAVIHNGSDTSHLKYYSALKLANVDSTKQLVSTCLQRMIPFHYVSSAGVALFAERDAFPPVSCTTTGKTPPADGSHGYMCGKWVCEKMLERVYEQYHLPIVIQRPSTIIRSGEDAAVERAGFDWVNSLLHFAHQTQTVPRVDHNAGAFDLVSVDTCCSDVARKLTRATKERITYVNNVGDVVIPMASMADVGLDRIGKRYNVLTMDEWTKTVVEAGMHPAVAALIETFDEPGVEKYPMLLRE
ncbi:highly reducing polyketide synthase sthA [Parastagonospora nodorum]|nr:highly reducing polyketide synthase sthA [Parastagonospora nodorum]KAH6033532.1 highly reducing polyketide synthase sthA [Parastagonospora nodorum]KAH6141531.1 highly reducing polyketide synthase sthA [Parastagonospora nodorum]KAH6179708.1 highly reducing polyketide synthase sthA [Parastagonospora nodorum]